MLSANDSLAPPATVCSAVNFSCDPHIMEEELPKAAAWGGWESQSVAFNNVKNPK